MDQDQNASVSLRDSLTSAFDSLDTGSGASSDPNPNPVGGPDKAVDGVSGESEAAKAQRARDEAGRFAKTEKPVDKPAVPEVKVRTRPSSWAKEYEQHWSSLPPEVQDYIEKRERDYSSGVSKYKQEADKAAPVWKAIEPFLPELQQHNLDPGQWISNLGNAHRALALGSPQQKLAMFSKLAQDYGVPLQALLQNQGGTTPAGDPMLYQHVMGLQQQLEHFKRQQEEAKKQETTAHIQSWAAGKEHFEQVKESMAGLLQSGLARDLDSAYEQAIRLNDDIWAQVQAKKSAEAETKRAEEAKAAVQKARAAAVSPRTGTPTGPAGGTGGTSDRRSTLEKAFSGLDGRV